MIKIFTGTANISLAQRVASEAGRQLDRATVGRFADGEIHIELLNNVRGCDAVIVQSTCSPANDTLMELILMADALKRSSVNSILAVIPYFGYGRQWLV